MKYTKKLPTKVGWYWIRRRFKPTLGIILKTMPWKVCRIGRKKGSLGFRYLECYQLVSKGSISE